MLLQRGDTWRTSTPIEPRAGRDIKERSVITYYGSVSSRPRIITAENNGISLLNGASNNFMLIGIHFYAKRRNPADKDFVGFENINSPLGIEIFESDNHSKGILIEDCHFDFFANNTAQKVGSGSMTNIVFRRNIFTNNYSVDSHSQGLYSANASILLEENFFDHNGWVIPSYRSNNGLVKDRGQATIFNHGTYFVNQQNTVFSHNIFLRSSSGHNKFTSNSEGTDLVEAKNIYIDNNFYFEGEVALSLGGNTDFNNGPRWQNIQIVNNVLTNIGKSQPTNREIGWGIDVDDWESGVIANNILMNWGQKANGPGSFGIRIAGHTSGVIISQNKLFDVSNDATHRDGIIVIAEGNFKNVSLYQNELQLPSKGGGNLLSLESKVDLKIAENNYYSSKKNNSWFTVDNKFLSIYEWLEITGESNQSRSQITYKSPERSIFTYLSHIGESTDVDVFVDRAISESRNRWTGKYTARALNTHIKEGFERAIFVD